MKHHEQKNTQENHQQQAEQKTRDLAAIRATFTSEHGKRTLRILEQSAGLHTPAAIPGTDGKIDPYASIFRDGRKSILLEIHSHLRQAEDQPEPEPRAKR